MPKCQGKNAQALASIRKKQQTEKKKGKNCTSLSYSEKQAGSALLCSRSSLNGHGRLGFGRVSSVPHEGTNHFFRLFSMSSESDFLGVE